MTSSTDSYTAKTTKVRNTSHQGFFGKEIFLFRKAGGAGPKPRKYRAFYPLW